MSGRPGGVRVTAPAVRKVVEATGIRRPYLVDRLAGVLLVDLGSASDRSIDLARVEAALTAAGYTHNRPVPEVQAIAIEEPW